MSDRLRRLRDGEPMADEFPQDRPMTEEEWEKMMRESDVRAARFGELLETLMDHPNGNELVAREMGWNELADAMAESDSDKDAPEDDADEGSFDSEESDENDFDSDE